MQNRRTEVTQTGQTRLSEEPTVPAASVEEASGCLVYRGGRATRTGQAGEWTHPSSVASYSNSEKRSEIQGADESSVTMSGCYSTATSRSCRPSAHHRSARILSKEVICGHANARPSALNRRE